MAGKTQLIGVYALPVTRKMIKEQAEILSGDDSPEELERIERQLKSAVLVEVLVTDADDKFEVGDFAQENPMLPRESWQAAWAEAFLTSDGKKLLVERGDSLPPGTTSFRVAFFLHFWQPKQPLITSYGELSIPDTTSMPKHLAKLVPYELLD